MGIIGPIPPSYDAPNEVVCLLLTVHPAPSTDADRESPSRWKRLCARLRSGHERGSAVLEMAFCMPVLMVLLTGICATGITLAHYEMLNNAVSGGAMQLATVAGQLESPYDPCAVGTADVEALAPALITSKMVFSFTFNGVAVGAGTQTCPSTSNQTGAAGNLGAPNATLSITVTYPCNLRFYGANYFPTCTLTTTSSEAAQ